MTEARIGCWGCQYKHWRGAFYPADLPSSRWRKVNIERLETFVRALPPRRRQAIEFRDASWYVDEVFALLRQHRVALCLHDMAGSATGQLTGGPFAYVRCHGPQKYRGRCDDSAPNSWAGWMAEQLEAGRPVYAYLNNDIGAQAPHDAVRLRAMLAARQRAPAHWRTA